MRALYAAYPRRSPRYAPLPSNSISSLHARRTAGTRASCHSDSSAYRDWYQACCAGAASASVLWLAVW
jgi:hypothetical protein